MKQTATEATAAMSVAELEQIARRIRASCIQMAQDGKEGHLSSSLAYVDALTALYFGWLRLDPARSFCAGQSTPRHLEEAVGI
jgi:transketolase N-terminal domain/subunit